MSAALHPFCDAAGGRSAATGKAAAHPQLVLATTILASSLAFIDGSVVNVGLPAIGRSVAADAAGLQWIINAYLLPLSALLLLGGMAGDRFGRRRLLMGGTGAFAFASLGCALAPDLATLLASRVVQGVGAAMLLPNSLALLGKTFSGPAKGRAIGVWAAAGAAAGAVGPVLGGWLIDLGSWRAIFLINLPLAASAVMLASRYLEPDENGEDQPLDTLGASLATLGVVALTWALTVGSGRRGWTRTTVATGVAALPVMLLFTLVEKRRGDRAMMPVNLFASRTFLGLTLFHSVALRRAWRPFRAGALCADHGWRLLQHGGWSGVAAIAARHFGDVASDWRSRRPDRPEVAARNRVARGCRWVPARVEDRQHRALLDRGNSGCFDDFPRGKRRGRSAHNSGAKFSRRASHWVGIRVEQRGGPNRWSDRDRTARRGTCRRGRGTVGGLPCGDAYRRGDMRGRGTERVCADRSMTPEVVFAPSRLRLRSRYGSSAAGRRSGNPERRNRRTFDFHEVGTRGVIAMLLPPSG
jgi:MFS family permease